MYVAAADAVCCYINDVRDYRRANPNFQDLCELALERYRSTFILEAQRRAVEGYEVPIIGGRNRDEVVAKERRFSDRLLELFLKRGKDDSFRDKQELTVNGGLDLKAEMDLSTLSQRARVKLRELLEIINEDEANRTLGKEVE
jgi:hypothetical protein